MPIPEGQDIFLLKREMPPSDKTALQCVMEVDQERIMLEHEAEVLATKESDRKCSTLVLFQSSNVFLSFTPKNDVFHV